MSTRAEIEAVEQQIFELHTKLGELHKSFVGDVVSKLHIRHPGWEDQFV